MEMEATLLRLFIKPKISKPFEAKNFLLHKNMLLEVIKVIKKNLEFLRSFVMGNSQHDGYHAGSTLQGFVHMCIVENLVGHKM